MPSAAEVADRHVFDYGASIISMEFSRNFHRSSGKPHPCPSSFLRAGFRRFARFCYVAGASQQEYQSGPDATVVVARYLVHPPLRLPI